MNITIVFLIFSFIGTILNMFKRKEGFICWAVSNMGWGTYMYFQSEGVMAFQFGVYFFIALISYRYWAVTE